MRIEIPFIGSSKQARSENQSNQRTINMYPEFSGGKTPMALYRTPGLKLSFSLGSGPCRCNGVVFKSKLYFVSGNKLISVNSLGSSLEIGTLTNSGSRVSMKASQNYLVLVNSTEAYTYDGTTFALLSDPDFPNTTTHIDVMNGRWLAIDPDTGNFYMSASDDPTSWSALDFANAEAQPDLLKALIVVNDILYLVGENTAEGWYFSGNADFPFSPIQGGTTNVGIVAPYSLVSNDDVILYLGATREGGPAIIRQTGAVSQIVSDDNINWQLSKLSKISDAEGAVYYQSGHIFYILTFPTDGRTFCYDLTAPKEYAWTERESFDSGRWRVSGIGYLDNKIYCGDYSTGNYYTFDFDIYQENGDFLKWLRRTQVLHNQHQELTFWELVVDIDGGQDSSIDPQIMMRYSDDGGESWSDELWTSAGKVGNRGRKASWQQLGTGYERMFEISGTDNVNTAILGAYAEVEVSDV